MSTTSVSTEAPGLDGAGAAALLDAMIDVVGRLGRQALSEITDDAALAGSVTALHRVETMVAAEKLRRIAEVDARGAYQACGVRSTADLLGGLGLTRGEARTQVQTATALAALPRVAGRLASGRLGVGQAAVAARALDDLPAFPDGRRDAAAIEALDTLVAVEGATQDRRQLGRTVDGWVHRNDPGLLAERERLAHQRRHLWAGRGHDGQPLVEGRLTPMVLAKLGAVLDPLSRRASEDDDRTIGQRRHDALETVLDRAAIITDRHPEPDHVPAGVSTGTGAGVRTGAGGPAGEPGLPVGDGGRPQVLLITSPEALHGLPGARVSELDGWGPVSSETARQVCCDADITTVTVGPNGSPLDVDRTRRFPTRRQRLAVIARDRRCVGCGTPASRCQVHHVRWRSHGGPTAIDNLTRPQSLPAPARSRLDARLSPWCHGMLRACGQSGQRT